MGHAIRNTPDLAEYFLSFGIFFLHCTSSPVKYLRLAFIRPSTKVTSSFVLGA